LRTVPLPARPNHLGCSSFWRHKSPAFWKLKKAKAANHRLTDDDMIEKVDLQNTREPADFGLRLSGLQELRPNLTVSAHRSAV